MKSQTTRRAVLASVASLPALAIIPATALGTAADPIFAAIERHRQIEAAYVAACNEPIDEAKEQAREARVVKLSHRSSDALGDLVAMTPTTLTGSAAVLRYLETHEKAYDAPALLDNHSDNVSVPARNLLSRIAATLESLAVQS
jgi:membrane-bound ClpP family serine protease